MAKIDEANKAFHRTSHKVRRPVNADVGSENIELLRVQWTLHHC